MVTLTPYRPELYDAWNRFVDAAENGTLFHRLDFLAYHGDRFQENERHVTFLHGDKLIGVMPLGFFTDGGRRTARSPFGASYGGLVIAPGLGLKYVLRCVDALIDHLKEQAVDICRITLPPLVHCASEARDFEFALYAKGFRLAERTAMHAVRLPPTADDLDAVMDGKCRNQTRKGRALFTVNENADVAEFYPILLENQARFNAAPTHSQAELTWLARRFPERVFCHVARTADGLKAGIGYFAVSRTCLLTFYMAQEEAARRLNGMNALVSAGMAAAVRRGFRVFDFGGSSAGPTLNTSLAEFKESFGGECHVRDAYVLELTRHD